MSGAPTAGGGVYLGSAYGLSSTVHWTADGGKAESGFGHAVAAAGDVDDDGNGDIIIGAPGYRVDRDDKREAGRADVYHGLEADNNELTIQVFLPVIVKQVP